MIMRLAGEKPFLEVVGDQRGCPTNADDLAIALKDLLASDLRGICHVTNTGDCTWHEFAEAIVSLMELSTPVRPITTAQAGRLARRPAYSVLAQGRLGAVRALLPHWKEALARFMRHAPRLASTLNEQGVGCVALVVISCFACFSFRFAAIDMVSNMSTGDT